MNHKIRILLFTTILIFTNLQGRSLEKVSVQFHWLDQFEFAGYYMAKEKGFYKDVGLDVQLKRYQYGLDVSNEVVQRKATYAVGGSDLIVDITNGSKLKLLAAVFQSSPLVLLTIPSSGIKSIKDFKNKKIMLSPDTINSVTFNAMLKKENLSFLDLQVLEHSFEINDLINKKTDLFQSYISNEPFALKQAGIIPVIFDPKDYGFDFYSEILFTSEYEIKYNKKRAIAFKEASLKGWKYAFENIEESVDVIIKKYNIQNRSREALIFEAKQLKKLAYYKNKPLGEISLNKINRMYDAYNIMNLIKNPIEIQDYVLFDMKKKSIEFTEEEKNYLAKKKSIKQCIHNNLLPFESLKNGEFEGVVSDIFAILENDFGINFEIVQAKNWGENLDLIQNNKCDIISLIVKTKEREDYLSFTEPYFSSPFVIVTKMGEIFLDRIDTILDEEIAVIGEYAIYNIFKEKYPSLKIKKVKSIKEGMNLVENGKVYGYIEILPSAAYYIQKESLVELKINGKFDEKVDFTIATRKDDILQSIMQKLLNTIDDNTKQQIYTKWISIKYENGVDNTLIWQIIIIFIFISFLLIYRVSILRKNKENLEKKIKIELAKSRKKDNLIFQQNKMASLGNMIANVAHQWRQPLSQLSMSQNIILRHIETNSISNEELILLINDDQKVVQFMSSTINTFQNFYKDDFEVEVFNLNEAYENLKYILSESIDLINVELVENIDKEIYQKACKNSISQVLLSILQNSLYFLKSRKIKDPKIFINMKRINNKTIIEIEDNAKGIEPEYIDQVFDYSFSKRNNDEKSTGLGLYISKLIIEEKFSGNIRVRNSRNGAKFSIEFENEL